MVTGQGPPEARAVIRVLDTSALAKRYVREAGTDQVSRVVESGSSGSVQVAYIALLEMRSLLRIAQEQRRITKEQAQVIRAGLGADLQSRIAVREIIGADWPQAANLVDRHDLRPADAIHLASAISLRDECGEEATIEFVCSDSRLCQAAAKEGFAVLDLASAP